MYFYKSKLVQAAHARIMSDEVALKAIGNALRNLVLSEDYISEADCIRLGNFIEDYYKLPGDYFGDVLCSDLKILGAAILREASLP